ncbi:Aste57867_23130 [Aphanomyces stellatus]|uniref:Aste57867_23130 protein n=1 Tax=Aphanomyces stellatus TaxID=120398 RepID=A0A485LM40_9STRA|nr:hypothetical protein As57867_023059 [Aphanomyces stellatus]VFT99778.1 Aste57867_23130 [Aphanomyces stellatus]
MILDPTAAKPETVATTHVPGIFDASSLRNLFGVTASKPPSRPRGTKPHSKRQLPSKKKTAPTDNDADAAEWAASHTTWVQQKIPNNTMLREQFRRRAVHAAAQATADTALEDQVRWIKNNVPIRSLPKASLSAHTKIMSFTDVLKRILHARLGAAFSQWHDCTVSDKHAAAVTAFVQSEAVHSLQAIWERSWLRKRDRCFSIWSMDMRCARAEEAAAAAVDIQRSWRRFRCRDFLDHRRRTRAATRLQSNYRRFVTRRHFRRALHEAAVARAATRIQTAYKRKRTREAFLASLRFYVQTQAAVVLQRWMRRSVHRVQWLRRRGAMVLAADAATCIQRAMRACLARSWCRRLREHKQATAIQRMWRRSWRRAQPRLDAATERLARAIRANLVHGLFAVLVQAVARGFLGRRRVVALRTRIRSATVLQRTWRRYWARQLRTKARAERRFRRVLAAHVIQAAVRGYNERCLFRMAIAKSCVPMYLRASRIRNKTQEAAFRTRFPGPITQSAASTIGTTWRKHRRRKEARRVACEAAAVTIQTIYKSMRIRRWFRAYAARVTRSAMQIQRMVRARQARDRSKQYVAQMRKVVEDALKARLDQAARRVQAAWHRKTGRMAAHLRKQAEEERKRRHVAAAKSIQRFVRQVRHRRQFKTNMAASMGKIVVLVAARHAAARCVQRNYRAYHASRLGKAMLASLKLARRKRERREKRQRIIADYLVEATHDRGEENEFHAKVASNHDKIQGEKDRKAAEAAAAKAERRRLALLAAENNVRPSPPITKLKIAQGGAASSTTSPWVEAWDATQNQKYFYNAETGESKWAD